METPSAFGGRDRISRALVALGSNWSDAASCLDSALRLLEDAPGTRVVAVSSARRTRPVGVLEQPDFLNAVATLETTLDPFATLRELRKIESALGRERKEFWGPRTIDLDLILFDEEIIDAPTLTIPHPRLYWRDFVLDPACEIAPEWVVPTTRLTLRETRAALYWTFRNFETTSRLIADLCCERESNDESS